MSVVILNCPEISGNGVREHVFGARGCVKMYRCVLDLNDGKNFTTMEWLVVFVKVPL